MQEQERTEEAPIAEWELKLLQEQHQKQQLADAKRLALLPTIEATELTWVAGGVRVTLTPKDPTPLSTLLDEVSRLIDASTSRDERSAPYPTNRKARS